MAATTTSAPPRPAAGRRPGPFVGTGTLVRFMLRRDRVRLPAWAAGFALFILYLVSALPQVAETEADLANVTALFNDPVGRMLIGPGYGFDAPTLERLVANGYGLYLLILAALTSILLVLRHTRVEEQTGRAELVHANVVGRHATLTATLVMAVLTNLAAAVAVAVTMVGVGGYGVEGSLVLGAATGATGLAFAGLTAIAVQLTEYSRAAGGIAGAVLGAAFVIRAGGDMAEVGGTGLSWVAPLAWGQQTAPFVLDRWWPLLLPIGFAALTTAIGYRLSTRRDLAASLFAVRPGSPEARPSLGTPLGLALRLQRAGIIGWTLALGISGLVFGAYADALLGAMEDLPEAFRELFGEQDLLGGYLAFMARYMAYVAAVYVVLAVQGLRAEETRGRAEPVLATPVSRWAWLGSHLVVIAAGVVVIMAVAGAATGVGAAIVTGDVVHVGELTLAHLNQVPPILVVLGVAALLFGVLPRAVPATWALVGYGLIIGTFGPMLDLPAAAFDLSPYEYPAELPLEAVALGPLVVLTLAAVAGAVVGLLGLRRRGINVA